MNKAKEEKALNKLRDEIHQNAIEHGWWQEERSFGDIIALCHSELSEALEEYRNGHKPNEIYHTCRTGHSYEDCPFRKDGGVLGCEDYKPLKLEGIPSELADVIIRILDYCGKEGIDIEEAIRTKHEYNKTRPYKHGGKVI